MVYLDVCSTVLYMYSTHLCQINYMQRVIFCHVLNDICTVCTVCMYVSVCTVCTVCMCIQYVGVMHERWNVNNVCSHRCSCCWSTIPTTWLFACLSLCMAIEEERGVFVLLDYYAVWEDSVLLQLGFGFRDGLGCNINEAVS